MNDTDTAAVPDTMKGMPGPLELSRMHEAELKRCYKQYGLLGALISQIMVGRVVIVENTEFRVTAIKIKEGKVQVHGTPNASRNAKKRGSLICDGLGGVTIIEGEKP